MGPGRLGWKLVVAVAVLCAWGCGEALWHWGEFDHPGQSTALAVLWASVLPLPLLLARRWPTLAGAGVVAIVLARAALDYRGPGSVAQSVALLAALFVVEGERTGSGPPWRGAAVGAALLGGVAAMDALDLGNYAAMDPIGYAHLTMLVVGGAGAGAALRDRRTEAAQLEAELRATDAGRESRIEALMAAERSQIAGEIDRSVALLLHRVRPRAERAALTADPAALRTEMEVVARVAGEAMEEMRRALRLLRAPAPAPAGAELDLASARAASRRTRLRQAAGWAAPVLLLAGIGLFEQSEVSSGPIVLPGMGGTFVPAPELGQLSPWISAVVCVLPLLGRARAPLAATAAVCALLLLRFELHDLSTLTFTQYYVAAAAGFFGAAHARSAARGVLAGLLAVGTSVLCMENEQAPYMFFGFVFAALLPAFSAAAGLAVRDRVATAARARRAREELDRRHEEMAREELAAERLRAARELHDVVGHVVTVIGLQAAVAARYAERDLEQAREAARTVVAVSGEAERDLGRLTAFLDVDGGEAPAGSVAELVARLRGAGLPVVLEERTGAGELPLPIAQVAFRLVQEALTNVSRHAGAAATVVRIERRGETLVVEVVNDLAAGGRPAGPPGPSSGLAGMRERAAVYGGSLEAGSDGAGRWRVQAELPLAAAAAASPA